MLPPNRPKKAPEGCHDFRFFSGVDRLRGCVMAEQDTGPSASDIQQAAELLPVVYVELRRLAVALSGRLPPGQTLQPTALVHEAYMRLVGDTDPGWNGRRYFFGAAARAMREILVDQARKASLKRGAQGGCVSRAARTGTAPFGPGHRRAAGYLPEARQLGHRSRLQRRQPIARLVLTRQRARNLPGRARFARSFPWHPLTAGANSRPTRTLIYT